MENIIKVNRKHHFTQVTNKIIRDESLSGLAVGIYSYLISHDPEKFKICKKNVESRFPEGRVVFAKAWQELIDLGWVISERVRSSETGKYTDWQHTIYDDNHRVGYDEKTGKAYHLPPPDGVQDTDMTDTSNRSTDMTDTESRETESRETESRYPSVHKNTNSKNTNIKNTNEKHLPTLLVQYLNKQAIKQNPITKDAQMLAQRLLDLGYTADQIKAVIRFKCGEWRGCEKMDQYLRPFTLFKPDNFKKYLAASTETPRFVPDEASEQQRKQEAEAEKAQESEVSKAWASVYAAIKARDEDPKLPRDAVATLLDIGGYHQLLEMDESGILLTMHKFFRTFKKKDEAIAA